MREAVLSELGLPFALNVFDGVANRVGGPFAAIGQDDALGSAIVGVGPALKLPEGFKLAEQVVGRLLAHAALGGQLRRAQTLRAGIEDEVHVGHLEVLEPVRVQALEHAPHDALPRHPQKRPDHRRAEAINSTGKVS